MKRRIIGSPARMSVPGLAAIAAGKGAREGAVSMASPAPVYTVPGTFYNT
jgi:hypothetical protein